MTGQVLAPAIWSKIGAVSIRTKIMGIVGISIFCCSIGIVWYTYRDDSASSRKLLQDRGIAIGTALSRQSLDPILTHNQFGLYSLIKETRDANKDLVYAFVLDERGDILAHTFVDGFPNELLNVNPVPSGGEYAIRALRTANDTIQDIAIPVLGGKAGVLRIGMSEAGIAAGIARHMRNIVLWVLLIMVLGLAVAYGLASILTVPFVQLAEATREVGRGEFRWKAPVWAKDELGSLGSAFDDMTAELRRREEMRIQLLAKVIDAQEAERKRIARELHDETSQSLTSLMVGLRSIESAGDVGRAAEKATELRAVAARTLDEVHRLAMELRPSLLDDLGLVSAVQRFAEEYSEKLHINVDCQTSGVKERRLSPQIEVAVYRIIQEALTNIAKHANAKNVSIVLNPRSDCIVATIEDDGIGFDINEVMNEPGRQKLGLFGMYERASLIGGRLSVESYRGTGTTVFLEVPLAVSAG